MDDKEYQLIFSHEFEEKEEFVNMIALKNNKMGVLFKTSFYIFNSKTFVKLLAIKENNIIYSKVFEIIDEQKEFIILISSEEYHIYQIENKTQKLIQKEKLSKDEFIIKISSNIFIIYKNFEIHYYKYDKDLNKFSINEVWDVYNPFPRGYREWLDSTFKIKRINYLPSRNSLLLIATIESRVDIHFEAHGHADIPLIGIAESSIIIYQHCFIFEYNLYGEYIQDIYEFEPIIHKRGILYKNGEVDIYNYVFDRIRIESIKIALVNTNILAIKYLDGFHTIINLNNKNEKKTEELPYFFGYDRYLYLNKNTILVIGEDYYDYDEIWEYTILNKEGINIEKYDEFSKKKIFDFKKNGGWRYRKAEMIKGIKMKNKIVYFGSISNKNYIIIFQILKKI